MSNVAVLAGEVADDESCGFEAQVVKDAVVVEGQKGEPGRAIYTVKDCLLGFATVTKTLENCGNDPVELSGRVIVDATMIVDGIVSGEADEPIIPAGRMRSKSA